MYILFFVYNGYSTPTTSIIKVSDDTNAAKETTLFNRPQQSFTYTSETKEPKPTIDPSKLTQDKHELQKEIEHLFEALLNAEEKLEVAEQDKLKKQKAKTKAAELKNVEDIMDNPITEVSADEEQNEMTEEKVEEQELETENIDANEKDFNPDYHPDWDDQKKEIMSYIYTASITDETLFARARFFHNLFLQIKECKPSIKPLNRYYKGIGTQGSTSMQEPYMTYEELNNYLITTNQDMYNLKYNHKKLLRKLPQTLPEGIYQKDSRGIVYVGGKKYSWLTTLSILNIRQTGCTLPIEVLIPKYDEYELKLCRDFFPKYNAKCVYLPRLVGEEIFEENNFKGYQYKSLALAFSSFEDVILLDADNSPLRNPTELFDSAPFKETGLILWPDFWKRTTKPAYYDIIGFDIDDTKVRDLGYHEYGRKYKSVSPPDTPLYHHLEKTLPDPTSESGQLVISKKHHIRSVILSLYYNTYGPDYYYPLLSQGAFGQGDKETFIAAAHALKEKYYTVKKRLISLGNMRNNHYSANAMGQFNPIQDYDIFSRYTESAEDVSETPDIFFVHANRPKMDPWILKNEGTIFEAETGKRNRLYGEKFIQTANFDFELRMWGIMKQLLCDDQLQFLTFSENNVATADVCEEVLKQLRYLENNEQADQINVEPEPLAEQESEETENEAQGN